MLCSQFEVGPQSSISPQFGVAVSPQSAVSVSPQPLGRFLLDGVPGGIARAGDSLRAK